MTLIDAPRTLVGKIIEFEGDTWEVGSVGVQDGDQVFCHLWSKTRILTTQRNGRKVPVQACTFVPMSALQG